MGTCIRCGSATEGSGCGVCIQYFAQRRPETVQDIYRDLDALARCAARVLDQVTYCGPDGPRDLVRELLPARGDSMAVADIQAGTSLKLELEGLSVLTLIFHAEEHVVHQYDTLAKELRVLADLTPSPLAYYAAPHHLRSVLLCSAMILHLTDPDTDFATRLGVAINHTISGLRKRRKEEVEVSGESSEEVSAIDDVLSRLRDVALTAGMPLRGGGGRNWSVDGIATDDTGLVASARGAGRSAGREYSTLSSALHGQRRRHLRWVDDEMALGAMEANPLAVTLYRASNTLRLAVSALHVMPEYAGDDALAGAARLASSRALAGLIYIGMREWRIAVPDAASES